LVRIDDIDPRREIEGSADRILKDLSAFGMRSDREVLYQSKRTSAYRAACQQLLDQGLAYYCGCTRAELKPGDAYPGTCRNGVPSGKQARSVRLRTDRARTEFRDGVQGQQSSELESEQGDFVIWRADGLPAYQLAAALDDVQQGITEVVRGADLLDSTFRQIHVQRALGLPSPAYAHVPVVSINGEKLSKRLNSDPLAGSDPVLALYRALRFLGQDPPRESGLGELWTWAEGNWDLARVPAVRSAELQAVSGGGG
jgi:glutamyl-Q tRNA(Asp) synthetase